MSGVTDVGKSPAWKVTRAVLILAGLWLLWQNVTNGEMAWLFPFFEAAWSLVLRIYEWVMNR
jgi:hypothetical protein